MMRLILLSVLVFIGSGLCTAVNVSNLDATCLKCICTAATECNENYDCSPEGFCGPFFISRAYWENAGSLTLNSEARYDLDGGFKSCVRNFHCASNVVTNYMAENGWDCNGDGVTDCDDYARIHYLGHTRCDQPIGHVRYQIRYMSCRPPKDADNYSQI